MFGLKKYDNLSTINEIENRDLLWISYESDIPVNYRYLHFVIEVNERGEIVYNIKEREKPDPSTIWSYLPIKSGRAEPLSYFPHYIDLSPEQRFAYLTWLRNVDNPVDMGYVFLYYYGLEKHLLIGNFDKAFHQIIRLRNVHNNKSFQKYSEQALIHSCIMRNRLDMLVDLHEKTEISGFSNAQFLLAYNLKMDISAQNLLQAFR